MYALGESAIDTRPEARLSAAFRKLHGASASIAQLKQGYARTRDPRYLDGVRNMLPLYAAALREYGAIAGELGKEERPSQFATVIADTGDWLARQTANVVEGATETARVLPTLAKNLTNPLVLLAIAGAVIVVTSGFKFPKRAS